MDRSQFNILLNEVEELHQQGQTQQALVKVDDLMLAISALPESDEQKQYLRSCKSERANLLFRLDRKSEAEELLREIRPLTIKAFRKNRMLSVRFQRLDSKSEVIPGVRFRFRLKLGKFDWSFHKG